LLTVN